MSGSVWGKKAVITFIIKYEFNPRYDLTLSVCNNPPQTLIFFYLCCSAFLPNRVKWENEVKR